MTNLHKAFRGLHDLRINRKKLHNLHDIIILSIIAVLSGAESWDPIELYEKTNIDFLKQILELKNGILSHDTMKQSFFRFESASER
ncbi:MAG: transposase family protein, partial [Prevotellaceae bacterium]|nr:transposase family protein [Prevotellaceae bacterium]